MLTCDNVTITIRDNILISNFAVSIFNNNLILIKGKNGCGKSTLLKILAGFIEPESGKIFWRGRNIHEDIELFQSTQIAYLSHHNSLKDFLTVKENLESMARFKETENMIPAALSQFGLLEFADQPIYKLSAGMQKKVALARIIVANAKLWLLDEPESNLDDSGKEMLAKLIKIRTQEGGLVILTSHSEHNLPASQVIYLEDFKHLKIGK
jgi:heme exporter protein A